MYCIERYEEHKKDFIDQLLMDIRYGKIKAGRYAHLVKIDKHAVAKKKGWYFDE